MRTIVAVTADIDDDKSRRHYLLESYPAALYQVGVIPLAALAPDIRFCGSYEDWAGAILERADGLLLSGGDDVNAMLYGGQNRPYNGAYTEERDEFEMALCRAAFARRKPVLGICRGIQALNVALGGTLFQDIAACHPGKAMLMHSQKAPTYSPVHKVSLKAGSLLAGAVENTAGDAKGELAVNSFHHQAVDRVAPGFCASALAPDGIVEAIEPDPGSAWIGHPFTLGVQWHPERMPLHHAHAARLFSAFAAACRGAA